MSFKMIWFVFDQLKVILNFLLRWGRLQERFGRGVSARRDALLPWREGGFLRPKEGLISLGEGGFLRPKEGLSSLRGGDF